MSLRADYSPAVTFQPNLPYARYTRLGEGNTPLINHGALATELGIHRLLIKDESKNPTGSHKDRMSALGAAQALDSQCHTLVLASSGNAALSAAYYAKHSGLRCEVACYEGLPSAYADALKALNASLFYFEDNAGRWQFVQERAQLPGYLALTNYMLPALGSAPLAIEGYKAIAYETHAAGELPDHVTVPTARGDLAWGIYAGFADLLEAGQMECLPKIWIVEPFGRLSRVLAGESLHSDFSGSTKQFSIAGHTVTYLQWQAAKQSLGGARVVNDQDAQLARQRYEKHGISAELCAAAALAATQQLMAEEKISPSETVMLMLTANASRDPSYPP